jgi:hypothetical protein
MKNVHLLPTDKPSRLVKFFTNKFHLCKEILPIQDEEQYQHIYITSDEEIKEGDWFYTSQYNTIDKLYSNGVINANYCKKIILTTDQDLIKNGVQSIDDEFLEWFVKNPSCESVGVVKEMYMPQLNGKISDGKITHELSLNPSDNTLPFYKIIIPQEEPKQETNLEDSIYQAIGKFAEIRYLERLDNFQKCDFKDGVFEGAKWQQEQDRWKTVCEETPPIHVELLVKSPEGIVHLSSWRESYNIFSCQAKSESSLNWKWKTI